MRCDTSESGALTWIVNNYSPTNYAVGTIVEVTSTTGSFPNTVICTDRYFRANL